MLTPRGGSLGTAAGDRSGHSGRDGVSREWSPLGLLGLELRVNLQPLQGLGGQVALEHSRFLVAIVEAKGDVPVGGGPGRPQVHQVQLVRVETIIPIPQGQLLGVEGQSFSTAKPQRGWEPCPTLQAE